MENVTNSTSQSPTPTPTPRSRRVCGILSPPPSQFDVNPSRESPQEGSIRSVSPTRTPPPPPPRSPLRPSPKSVSSFTTLIDSYAKRDTLATIPGDEMMPARNRNRSRSVGSLNALSAILDMYASASPHCYSPESPDFAGTIPDDEDSPPGRRREEKPLPSIPAKDLDDLVEDELEDDESSMGSLTATTQGLDTSDTSTISTLPTATPRISKRVHALNELLSSERAYASDLAFIRDVHIPLALGERGPFHFPFPATPPSSSGSSTRTVSTASSSSSSSSHGPPMNTEDVRMIFSNVGELALFSGELSERLEVALGDVLESGEGEDHVGRLFLEIIPKMEPFYKSYITRHPMALQHLHSLPKTPALEAYFARTQELASSITHSWDLPSLLIKPVQRLLKYPLLLAAIIEQTPDSHGDKLHLKAAMGKMEEVARSVNEGRRRIEIVKEILTGKTDTGVSVGAKKKISAGKSATVTLGRMKSISVGLRTPRPKEDNEAVAKVEAYEKRLKECDVFVREFAKDSVGWAVCVKKSIEHLREWALRFATTIGISDETPSDAFSAFLDVVDGRLAPLCKELAEVVSQELLPQLARLLDTSKSPTKLLEVMHSLENLHFSLLNNTSYSKSRPPLAMIEASQNYVALRSQLNSELPSYLKLLEFGIVRCIRQFARRQAEFWITVRNQWAGLWDCLRMEGETNAGCEETLRIWWNRYSEVDEKVAKLSLLRRDRITSISQIVPLPASPVPSSSSRPGSTRHRSFGSVDAVPPPGAHDRLHRTPSIESFPTTALRNKSRARTPESVSRRGARSNTAPLPASTSTSTLNTYPSASQAHLQAHGRRTRDPSEWGETSSMNNDSLGRKSRSSSFSRRLSESLKAPLRRSPSHKSIGSVMSGKSSSSYIEPPAPPLPLAPADWPVICTVVVVHPFETREVIYREHPFFHLQMDEIYDVVDDAGHPSTCEGLPLSVDDDIADSLLLVRNEHGEIGWALASYLVPLT